MKATLESLLWRSGAARLSRGLGGGRPLILCYHNVRPRGAPPVGDRSLHVAQEVFETHLDALSREYDVVPLEAVLAPGSGRHSRRPAVAVTFDDGYRGALTVGVDCLAARGLPATFFITPGCLGGPAFWWDALAGDGLPESVRARALDAGQGKSSRILAWARDTGLRVDEMPPYALPVTASELAAAGGRPGVTLALHTWSHPNLTRLDAAELTEELSRPLEWSRAHCPEARPWIAYPYGMRSPEVNRRARDLGYTAMFSLAPTGVGLSRRRGPAGELPRITVPALASEVGILLRASGLLP